MLQAYFLSEEAGWIILLGKRSSPDVNISGQPLLSQLRGKGTASEGSAWMSVLQGSSENPADTASSSSQSRIELVVNVLF